MFWGLQELLDGARPVVQNPSRAHARSANCCALTALGPLPGKILFHALPSRISRQIFVHMQRVVPEICQPQPRFNPAFQNVCSKIGVSGSRVFTAECFEAGLRISWTSIKMGAPIQTPVYYFPYSVDSQREAASFCPTAHYPSVKATTRQPSPLFRF